MINISHLHVSVANRLTWSVVLRGGRSNFFYRRRSDNPSSRGRIYLGTVATDEATARLYLDETGDTEENGMLKATFGHNV